MFEDKRGRLLKSCFDCRNKTPYKCMYCDFKTPSVVKIVNHQVMNHGLPSANQIKDEVTTANSPSNGPVQPYICKDCEFQTNDYYALQHHRQLTHTNHFTYTCDRCKYETDVKHDMRAHINTDACFRC